MDLLDKIKACQTMKQLDDLRQEIHIAATYNEIDFKFVQREFLKKKSELEGLVDKNELNWIVRNTKKTRR